jgi:hypothetical protein
MRIGIDIGGTKIEDVVLDTGRPAIVDDVGVWRHICQERVWAAHLARVERSRPILGRLRPRRALESLPQ